MDYTCDGTSTCAQTPINTNADCDDKDACTYDDKCTATGSCEGTTNDCDSLDTTCMDYTCDGTSICVQNPNTNADCDDNDLCTYDDKCTAAGTCEGLPIKCDDTECWHLECDGTDTCAKTVLACGGEPCIICNSEGACVDNPGESLMMCDGACVNILRDNNNCGGCTASGGGDVCESNELCVNGICVKKSGEGKGHKK
jgi:hypothetical protein